MSFITTFGYLTFERRFIRCVCHKVMFLHQVFACSFVRTIWTMEKFSIMFTHVVLKIFLVNVHFRTFTTFQFYPTVSPNVGLQIGRRYGFVLALVASMYLRALDIFCLHTSDTNSYKICNPKKNSTCKKILTFKPPLVFFSALGQFAVGQFAVGTVRRIK